MPEQTAPNTVYHIIAFAFPGQKRADEVVDDLKSSAKAANMKIVTSAVVEVDPKGKTHVDETGHGTAGTAVGLVTGGLLGLIGGPAGLLVWALGGAVIGGVAGKRAGQVIPKEDLEALGRQLPPNSSAFIVIVEDRDAEAAIDAMQGYNAQVVTLTIGDQVSGEIDS
ncbi:MAG: DUF1269 domain-containing protein, partial [Anaerolineae bacterium]|nr:DUF1269 domain-containing protein [Anaerolineae bacterium]